MCESLIAAYVLECGRLDDDGPALQESIRKEELPLLRRSLSKALARLLYVHKSSTVKSGIDGSDNCLTWPWKEMDELAAGADAESKAMYEMAKQHAGLVFAEKIDVRHAIEVHYRLLDLISGGK